MTEPTEAEEITGPPEWLVVSRNPSGGTRLIEADEVVWTDDRIPTLFKVAGETVAAVAPGSWSFIGQVPLVDDDDDGDGDENLALVFEATALFDLLAARGVSPTPYLDALQGRFSRIAEGSPE